MASKGNRLTEENYCARCEYKIKNADKKSWCEEYDLHISEAKPNCWMLQPFRLYKEEKLKKAE